MKTEFESRIEFYRVKLRLMKKPVYQATVYWNGKYYDTTKNTKNLCIQELMNQAGVTK